MRIGLIAPPWFRIPPTGYGGTERVVDGLASELTRRGHDVTTFAAPGSTVPGRVVSPLGAVPPAEALGDVAIDVAHALGAYRQLQDFDVVHDHSGFIGPALAAVMPERPPVVHTLHGPWTDTTRDVYGRMSDRVHLVAISAAQAAANSSIPYAGVVHNGLAAEHFPLRRDKEPRLVWVGRANPDKGLPAAIEAARLVGMPISVLVKVNEPAERAYWDEVVTDLLDDDVEVVFNAGHDVKVDRVGRATALLLPLQWEEPFGLVMIEALACGTPVVAFDRGSAREIVAHAETGFVVDPATGVEGIAAAAADARHLDPGACRARFESHFTTERMVDGYERIYRRVREHRAEPSPSRAAIPHTGRHLAPTRVPAGAGGLSVPRDRGAPAVARPA